MKTFRVLQQEDSVTNSTMTVSNRDRFNDLTKHVKQDVDLHVVLRHARFLFHGYICAGQHAVCEQRIRKAITSRLRKCLVKLLLML